MSKKLLFIYNPKAGKAQVRSRLADIVDIFTAEDYLVTVYATKAKEDAREMAGRLAQDFDRIVCSGGDGTLDEVITGLIQNERKVPVGYIPSGSTNDFGASLNIPKDIRKAAKVAASGNIFPCDIGRFNEDIFVYIAAFGIFTEVSYGTNQQMKNLLGHMAYLLEGVKSLSAIKSYPMKISYEDVKLEGDFIYGMITNSMFVGGFKRITGKNVVLDDGVFEVMLIKRPTNALEINQIITALMNEDIDAECMYCFRTDKLCIESEGAVAWTLDGEYGGSHKKIEILNLNQVQELIVPNENP